MESRIELKKSTYLEENGILSYKVTDYKLLNANQRHVTTDDIQLNIFDKMLKDAYNEYLKLSNEELTDKGWFETDMDPDATSDAVHLRPFNIEEFTLKISEDKEFAQRFGLS